jgi:putative ABC transport system permease protein
MSGRLWLVLRMAGRSLLAHRLRTALAVLGVVIGVAAVIMLTAMGEGAQQRVNRSVSTLGVNLLFVYPSAQQGAHGVSRRRAETLTVEDAEAIGQLPSVATAAPEVRMSRLIVSYESREEIVEQIVGTWPQYQTMRNLEVAAGRFFDSTDLATGRRACVLGGSIAARLFGWNEAVGRWIRIGRQSFQVVGVMVERGTESAWMRFDEYIYLPVSSMLKYLTTSRKSRNVDQLTVMARDASKVEAAMDETTTLLRRRHQIGPGAEADFEINSQVQYQQMAQDTTVAFTNLLAGIAVVSLLVGGIGIMNVMIVTVMERTREIGVRKAIGARKTDILQQFMLESFLISFVGGVGGIGVGIAGAKLLPLLPIWEQMRMRGSGGGPWESYVSPEYVLMAFGFACAVGLFFGIYPAYKAARLNPVEALRYE